MAWIVTICGYIILKEDTISFPAIYSYVWQNSGDFCKWGRSIKLHLFIIRRPLYVHEYKECFFFVLLDYSPGKMSKNRVHLKFGTLVDFLKNWPIWIITIKKLYIGFVSFKKVQIQD